MSILPDRPVTWQNLEDLRVRFNLNHGTFCKFFGIPVMSWTEIHDDENKMAEPVSDGSLAILARIYDAYPEMVPRTMEPDMREVYESLNEQKQAIEPGSGNIVRRHFSVLFGRNSSVGYAWLEKKRASMPVYRIVEAMQKGFNGYQMLKNFAEIESRARGVDPFKTGKWK